ncbi:MULTISPECIES: cupin domain-containing protein [Streptomyces]|uniref:Cupin n=2 Tax=Streptomyces violaceusniger group TaxID=2839105 RepID=A0A499UX13_9ACTN|nr:MULTISPECIES: cupin domain-containing protein [Streptomyces]MBO3675998.1 helix-turn-helix domain-containing protein [Streptomyces sp. NEAU-YJ-81]BBJ46514.1 cupin [Streptomyces antimycoticus]SED56480.1 Cupin domain-containing protein [Streptomyces melanosporofaciens]
MENEHPTDRAAGTGDESVGDRLRALRKARRLTLRTVAEAAAISEGYLSQIERGQANPSIATLQQVAAALGLKVADLFGDDFTSGPSVLRAEEAPRLALGVLGGRKFRLTPGPQHHLEVFLGEFDAHGSTGETLYSHGDSEEFLYVLEGTVSLQLGDRSFTLGAGDSIRYSSAVPHRLSETAAAAARVLWVISPPSY